jgi:hypothetical protein
MLYECTTQARLLCSVTQAQQLKYQRYYLTVPIPVAAPSKTQIYSLLLAGIWVRIHPAA